MDNKLRWNFLSGNQLKIIALITMTCDHIGKELLPGFPILRIIGRLAFPIFAYMIAEGCKYTKNRKKYLLTMVAMAVICQIVYYIAIGSLYQCILVTFSLSIAFIYAIDYAMKNKTVKACLPAIAAFACIYFICEIFPGLLPQTDFMIDYGIWGVVFPAFIYIADRKEIKLVMAAIALIFLCLSRGGNQWYSLLSLIFLALYSGKRGKANMKYLFYVYYPLHLVVIYAIGLLFP